MRMDRVGLEHAPARTGEAPPFSGPPGEESSTGNSKPGRGLFADFAKGVK